MKLLPSRARSLISRSQGQLVNVKVKRLGITSSLCPAAKISDIKFTLDPDNKMSEVSPQVTSRIKHRETALSPQFQILIPAARFETVT